MELVKASFKNYDEHELCCIMLQLSLL